jgi:hypothetical protein
LRQCPLADFLVQTDRIDLGQKKSDSRFTRTSAKTQAPAMIPRKMADPICNTLDRLCASKNCTNTRRQQ